MTDLSELRARLAQRQSFFGGSVSTRDATTSSSWHVPEPEAEPVHRPSPPTQQKRKLPAAAVPLPQAGVQDSKRQKLKTSRDFSGLSANGLPESLAAGSQKAALPPASHLSSSLHPVQHSFASSAASARRSPSPTVTSQQPSLQVASAQTSAAASVSKRAVSPAVAPRQQLQSSGFRSKSATPPPLKANALPRSGSVPSFKSSYSRQPPSSLAWGGKRVGVTPKGKKGAVARSSAVAPQAVGGATRKEMANLALRQQIEAMRPPGSTKSASAAQQPAPSMRTVSSAAPHRPMPTPTPRPGAAAARPVDLQAQRLAGQALSQPADHRSSPHRLPTGTAVRKPQLPGRPALVSSAARHPVQYDSATDEDDDFLDDGEGGGDWRAALKEVTGYDPSRFANERFDDRSMEASWQQIQAEERRSARMGRSEDEKAEQEELQRLATKAAKKFKRKPQKMMDT